MDKITHGLDLSNEIADQNMRILVEQLGITEADIENAETEN